MSNIQFDTDMLSLLPPWYREILDYQQICQTEREQMEALADSIQAVADNMFFQTMDEASIYLWEQILNIVPNPQTETLGFRQARVISRLSSRPPFTIWFLYQKLDELIGPGRWSVNMDYPNYTLYIKSAAQNQSYATEVAFTVNRIKPAHIVYVNTPYVESGILLSESISLTQRNFNYLLGQWSLGELPFSTDIQQGVIKLPDTPSIQPRLLTGVANFVSGDVASALINGTIPISEITKTVSGSTLTVQYTVLAGDITEISTVALLDADGNQLTSSTVYVPVSGATLLEHTIPVSEGVSGNGQ